MEDDVVSKPVLEALTVANEYCLFFEGIDNYSKNDIFSYFQKIAPLLYLKGCTVPKILVNDESFSQRFVTEEQWEGIFKQLRKKFGDDDTYYVLDHNNDTIEASLSDNMADIYQDMKDFVMLYQKGSMYAKENAVFQFSVLMQTHWGPIVVDALKACHYLLYDQWSDSTDLETDHPWLF
jgi:hypothetical protein